MVQQSSNKFQSFSLIQQYDYNRGKIHTAESANDAACKDQIAEFAIKIL